MEHVNMRPYRVRPTYWRLATALGFAALTLASASAQLFSPMVGYVPHRILVRFRAGAKSSDVQKAMASVHGTVSYEIPHIGVKVITLPSTASESSAIKALQHRPEVHYAELDGIVRPSLVPNDTYYSYQWALPDINCPSAWNTTTGSSSIIIAFIDTGVDPTHPDLQANEIPGWDTYNNTSSTNDVYGHGTACAGQAAAIGNNGVGVSGVAWGCKIMPVKISDDNANATVSSEAAGITWAADHGARVAVDSWGTESSSSVSSAASYFMSKGGLCMMPAGNSGLFNSAADCPYVLTLSGLQSGDTLWSSSNTGSNVDVCAPAVNITCTTNNGGYGGGTGTCAAAALTGGTAALVLSANPSLTGTQLRTLLEQNSDPLGGLSGWNSSYGWGKIDAAKAVAAALAFGSGGGGGSQPPTVTITAPTANATLAGSAPVAVNATDNAGVSSVTLSVDGKSYASSTVAPYGFVVDTTTLKNGSHTFSAMAVDVNNNTSTTQVAVSVNNPVTPPTVTITSPASGAKATNPMSVTASASDTAGSVAKVELFVDGKLVATDTSAPYSFNVNTKKWSAGTHNLVCEAFDASGNMGTSSTVSVTK